MALEALLSTRRYAPDSESTAQIHAAAACSNRFRSQTIGSVLTPFESCLQVAMHSRSHKRSDSQRKTKRRCDGLLAHNREKATQTKDLLRRSAALRSRVKQFPRGTPATFRAGINSLVVVQSIAVLDRPIDALARFDAAILNGTRDLTESDNGIRSDDRRYRQHGKCELRRARWTSVRAPVVSSLARRVLR
ncbi:hypothetical protein Bphy_2286 [Paraburkholderia phymatum STM815]|uniref:Uncharacterized protein n=1 Tax=Paraburkholderia phymatum (strain DSM 17167 / CIP 108236 / LMG 21445 / STM815) TaxID=391038 RepID=B2JF93_PARP8|nr:hypothetical protein Bphy_2286 [Paraburkholderia phymatum STM815]